MYESFRNLLNRWTDGADPRSVKMFLIKSPYPVAFMLMIYFVTLKLAIPLVTKNKKHIHLRYLLAIYYVADSIINLALVLFWVYIAIGKGFNFRCEPMDYSDSYFSRVMILLAEIFLWIKFAESVESFLLAIVYGHAPIYNVLHHTVYPCMLTIGIRFYPGGSATIYPLMNCLEHTLLYAVLATRQISSKFKKSCTWFRKFHIILSVGSMVLSIIYYIQLETRADCDYTIFRYYILTCLLLFSFAAVYFRWSYILKPDAFGDTKIIKMIMNRNERKL